MSAQPAIESRPAVFDLEVLKRGVTRPKTLRVLPSLTIEKRDASVRQERTATSSKKRAFAGTTWIGGLDLLRPLLVRLSWTEEDGVIAEDAVTGIFGSGRDLGSAVQDFRAALAEHRSFLLDSAPLSEQLQETLEYLQRHLKS